jgi:plasmid stabilization system protein ParE
MALIIRWTPKTATWLDTQLSYWEENEMSVAAAKFSKDLDKKLKRLIEFPETGRATSSFKKIRFVVIVNVLIYFTG